VAASGLGWPAPVGAHGTGHDILADSPAVALAFYYSDGAPMQYAEVLVFSPQDPSVEHQNGRTDKHGRFLFCPDSQGEWQVKVSDGMGHAEQAAVAIDAARLAGRDPEIQAKALPAGKGLAFKTVKVVTGLSLILNAALGVLLFQRRHAKKNQGDERHAS
jgi:nickel transport protein